MEGINKSIISSDAAWYCRHDLEEERFYEIFFKLCKKYNIRWASADEKEKQFLSEVVNRPRLCGQHKKAPM